MNFNIGMFYFMNQKYEEAYSLFLENVQAFGSEKELVFLGSVCTHLSLELPDCFIKFNDVDSPYYVFTKFYQMKKEGKESLSLTFYIMNTILEEQLMNDEYLQPMWAIFEYEMLELVKMSKKNFSDYLKFREMQESICKYR